MTNQLEAHIAELQKIIDGPNGRYWAQAPAFRALIAALEKMEGSRAYLLHLLEQKEKRIAELESDIKFPGVMRCNTCNFSRSNVIVTPTGMRAGESTPEQCPNGCGPLWHDTYRRQYNELYDAYKQLEASQLAVKLPNRLQPGADGPDDWYLHSDPDGEYMKADDVVEAIRAAGITVQGDE